MSGINSGAENKKSLQLRAAWKIFSRKRIPSMAMMHHPSIHSNSASNKVKNQFKKLSKSNVT
jgi:hypothetical protein